MTVLQHINQRGEAKVSIKISKSAVHWKARALPESCFEDQQLTSFAGLVVFQALFERVGLRRLPDVATPERLFPLIKGEKRCTRLGREGWAGGKLSPK